MLPRQTAYLTCILLLLCLTTPIAVTTTPATTSPIATTNTPPTPDTTIITVTVTENGTAHWRIQYRIRLDTTNKTAAFTDFQAAVRNNTSAYLTSFRTRIHHTVNQSTATTNRSMTAANFSLTTSIRQLPQQYGIITYRFTWQQFATHNATALQIGDALHNFFLTESTRLIIDYPDHYTLTTVQPTPTTTHDGAVSWHGPLEFTGTTPTLHLRHPHPTSTPTHTTHAPTTTPPQTTPATTAQPTSFLPYGIGVVLVIGILTAGYWLTRQSQLWNQPASNPNPTSASKTRRRQDAVSDTETESPDLELLSNEEQVLHVVEEHGGRIKQQEIVTELGWTDAKTSKVISEMTDDNLLEKYRLGRENVITLPDVGLDRDRDAADDTDTPDETGHQ